MRLGDIEALEFQRSPFNPVNDGGLFYGRGLRGAGGVEDNHALLSQWNAVQDDVSAISIDCGSAKDTCAELNVVSVPAIRLYHGEKNMFRFRGPRKASSYVTVVALLRRVDAFSFCSITSFLRRLHSPAMTRLSEEDISEVSTSDDFVFVPKMERNDDGLPSRLQLLERNLNRADVLGHSVEAYTELMISPLTRKSDEVFTDGELLVHYFANEEPDCTSYYVKAMIALAKTFADYLKFAAVDTNEYPDMPHAMGLESDEAGEIHTR
ncbi:hypothetical protein EsHS_00005578 [Epichloe bromicola]